MQRVVVESRRDEEAFFTGTVINEFNFVEGSFHKREGLYLHDEGFVCLCKVG